MTLEQKLEKFRTNLGDSDPIPKIVKLLENPSSPVALPGKISLNNHDCLHILLDKDVTPEGEAFIVGFCMGNDSDTNQIHVLIFKLFALYFYPSYYKFDREHLIDFNFGFNYGRSLKVKKINKIDFASLGAYSVCGVRQLLGISLYDLKLIAAKIERKKWKLANATGKKKLGEVLKWSSSLFAVVGGFILALNVEVSAYGFILLAMSSGQLLISSLATRERSLIVYSGSVFICVDLFGIYRWIINS